MDLLLSLLMLFLNANSDGQPNPKISNITHEVNNGSNGSDLNINIKVNRRIEPWSHNSGATVHFELTNSNKEEIRNVGVKFKSNFKIRNRPTDIWNAKIHSKQLEGDSYVYVIEFPANPNLNPGEEHNFGFNTTTLSPKIEYIEFITIAPKGLRYGKALQKSFLFYEANRSGLLPADNRIEWRSNSTVNDGSDVGLDLTGGYFDAGDHVKFGFPMAASMTMLSWGVLEYRDAYSRSGQLDEALKAIKWGTDYFLKAHITENGKTKEFYGQIGHGDTDHRYWGAPEKMKVWRPSYKIDANNPGSDLAAETAAALASASILFRSSNQAYANKLLKNAKQLYEFAETYRGKYSDSITDAQKFYKSWSGYKDELAWGAIWLYKATGDTSYLNKAKNHHNNDWGAISHGWEISHGWDNKTPGTAILLAQKTGEAQYRKNVERWLNNWVNGTGEVKYTSGGLAWRYKWGSLRISANTAFLAGVYSDTINDYNNRYSDFANSQINYILGKNPRNFSYMVGFGDNYPLRPHHRGSSGNAKGSQPNQHILYGALVGGPKESNDYAYSDDRGDWIANEVATDYNAAFTGALARMYGKFGGEPLSDAELNDLAGIRIR